MKPLQHTLAILAVATSSLAAMVCRQNPYGSDFSGSCDWKTTNEIVYSDGVTPTEWSSSSAWDVSNGVCDWKTINEGGSSDWITPTEWSVSGIWDISKGVCYW